MLDDLAGKRTGERIQILRERRGRCWPGWSVCRLLVSYLSPAGFEQRVTRFPPPRIQR